MELLELEWNNGCFLMYQCYWIISFVDKDRFLLDNFLLSSLSVFIPASLLPLKTIELVFLMHLRLNC